MEISKLKKLKKMAENGGSFDFERYHIVCDSYNAKLDSGKITVISGTYLYSNETVGEIYREICTCSYKNMEVLAVITPDGKMVVNKYSFTPDEKTDDIISFTEYSKRYRGKVMETVYEVYDKITPSKPIPYDQLEDKDYYKRRAVEVCYENGRIDSIDLTIPDGLIYDKLFGVKDQIEEIRQDFEENGDTRSVFKGYSIVSVKNQATQIDAVIREGDFLTPGEKSILDAVSKTDTKTVNISFEKNGIKSDFAKFSKETLINTIKYSRDIPSYNFENGKEGKSVCSRLDIKWDNHLYPSDIKEIRSKGKIIYSR
jgi:hypothetical protein